MCFFVSTFIELIPPLHLPFSFAVSPTLIQLSLCTASCHPFFLNKASCHLFFFEIKPHAILCVTDGASNATIKNHPPSSASSHIVVVGNGNTISRNYYRTSSLEVTSKNKYYDGLLAGLCLRG